jgi:SET and MYND domain-containing protein
LLLLLLLLQVYGFSCTCPRCQLEQQDGWAAEQDGNSSSGEWETDEEASDDADMDDTAHQEAAEGPSADPAAAAAAAAAGEEAGGEGAEGGSSSEAMDSTYLSLFLLKYVCPSEGCFGTMAALSGCDSCQCNVCGRLRTDAEFLASLEG